MTRDKLLATMLAAGAVAGFAGAVRADTNATLTTEYTRRIKVGETIQPLGETPFGESVSLYTGNISFRQVDVHLPGIGPDIILARTYEASGSPTTYSADLAMGDWDLATPQIATIIPGKRRGGGGHWRVNDSRGPDQRCTYFTNMSQDNVGFGLAWWHGYQLIGNDGSSQPLLKRTEENTLAPGGDTASYPAVTPSHWMLGCLASTSNGVAGEGFLGVAPDGTRYWFDHLAIGGELETLVEQTPWMSDPGKTLPINELTTGGSAMTAAASTGTGQVDPNIYWGMEISYMPRLAAHMYATQVMDRFGNWVRYRYDGVQLQEITASDGRHVVVRWRTDAALVDQIVAQPGTPEERVWKYTYDMPTDRWARRLTQVLQPDNSSWQLETGWTSVLKIPGADPDNMCYRRTFTQIASDDDYAWIHMVHPTGLEADFRLSLRGHARSWVPTRCAQGGGTLSPASEHIPPVYLSLALTTKTFYGPGVAPRSWTYQYSPAQGSTADECAASTCRDWQWVEVTDPEGSTTHYRYSNHWGYMEGKLLAKVDGVVQRGTDNPEGLQKETYTYADPNFAWAFPARVGKAMQDLISFANNDPTERLAPQVTRTKQLQGVTFLRETSSFDKFGNPDTVRRASFPGESVTETVNYWPVDSQWVLGQPWKTLRSGRVISQTEYDARILPRQVYAFGLLQATYGYATNGLLASITDPRTNTTTLADHKRGLPRVITFPDATTIRTEVDDLGQVTSVTNQLQDSTTYRYDAMGRLTQVSLTGNDSIAWNPVYRGFGRVGSAAYGLPWGHWRNEVRTGTALTTTLYDAMWQPRVIITEDTAVPGSRGYVIKRFDAAGRETYSSYPVASAPSVDDDLPGVRTNYDSLGRVMSVVQTSELGPLTTTRDYLPGFRTRVTNPRGYATTTSFQTFDEPSESAPVRIEAPEGVTTVIERDSYGKALSITRSGPSN